MFLYLYLSKTKINLTMKITQLKSLGWLLLFWYSIQHLFSRFGADTALIVSVSFMFHEMGHAIGFWVTGRAIEPIKYLPFLGAYVTPIKGMSNKSSEYTATVLAGPAFGIIFGTICLIVGVILNQPGIVTGSKFAILLNGFNLLPIPPLDGGHIIKEFLRRFSERIQIWFERIAIGVVLSYFGFTLINLVINIFRYATSEQGGGIKVPKDTEIIHAVSSGVQFRITDVVIIVFMFVVWEYLQKIGNAYALQHPVPDTSRSKELDEQYEIYRDHILLQIDMPISADEIHKRDTMTEKELEQFLEQIRTEQDTIKQQIFQEVAEKYQKMRHYVPLTNKQLGYGVLVYLGIILFCIWIL